MDVFLVPVAPDRYELYCEEPDEPEADEDGGGWLRRRWRRVMGRFRQMLADAEHERRRASDAETERASFLTRAKARLMRWVAESIAEQRLLWQLRGRGEATLVHPDDLSGAQADQVLKRSLQRDWERHRFWLIIDTLGGAASLPLMLAPGPNFIGYYFVFRIVGHYLSLRGARRGLAYITWTCTPNAALTMLRGVVADSPESREPLVRDVASRLQLEHLASFFQRAAVQ